MSTLSETRITRRRMLAGMASAGALAGLPSIVPSTVLGGSAPSNRITLAMIGTGRQGIQANLRTLVHMDDVQVVRV